MSGVAILAPGYPDTTGGVVDHTRRLVASWSAREPVAVLGNLREPPKTAARHLSRAGVRGVLIQYVPFLYARRGVSTYPEQFARAAREAGIRTCVFVHEPWVPPTRLPWRVLSPLQRRQLLRLIARTDAAVTPVPAWAEMLGPGVDVVYVGSTLGPAPAEGIRVESPVVFSPFAAGLEWSWIAEAVREIGAGLTVIGTERDEAMRHEAVHRWIERDWTFRGRLPAERVLEILAGAPLVLAPFVDGITGRRTSVLAALSTGARLVTSTGPLADQDIVEGPLDAAESRDAFVRIATRRWRDGDDSDGRAARRRWYDARFDPRKLDDALFAIVTGDTA